MGRLGFKSLLNSRTDWVALGTAILPPPILPNSVVARIQGEGVTIKSHPERLGEYSHYYIYILYILYINVGAVFSSVTSSSSAFRVRKS